MKIILYAITGFVVFWLSKFLAISIGQALGAGPFEAGLIVSAISILTATLVVCTMVIVDTIKSIKPGE
jgi:hypothetical protein